MPVIRDNNFSKDTYGNRVERLIAIEGNFASVQPVLSAPAHIADWTVDCMEAFSHIIAVSQLEMNGCEGATYEIKEKENLMNVQYQYVRNLGLSIYKGFDAYIGDYGFDLPFPRRRPEKSGRIDMVLKTYARHVASGVTPLIPEEFINRLSDAKDAFDSAVENLNKRKSDARHAVIVSNERFASDSAILSELKAWWFAKMGKNDDRIGLVGMVNPKM